MLKSMVIYIFEMDRAHLCFNRLLSAQCLAMAADATKIESCPK